MASLGFWGLWLERRDLWLSGPRPSPLEDKNYMVLFDCINYYLVLLNFKDVAWKGTPPAVKGHGNSYRLRKFGLLSFGELCELWRLLGSSSPDPVALEHDRLSGVVMPNGAAHAQIHAKDVSDLSVSDLSDMYSTGSVMKF